MFYLVRRAVWFALEREARPAAHMSELLGSFNQPELTDSSLVTVPLSRLQRYFRLPSGSEDELSDWFDLLEGALTCDDVNFAVGGAIDVSSTSDEALFIFRSKDLSLALAALERGEGHQSAPVASP